jgi:hypothetical protein
VMDLDSANRYATSFQNRMLKGYQALSTMDQIESNKQIAKMTLEPDLQVKAIKQDPKQGSDGDSDDFNLIEV